MKKTTTIIIAIILVVLSSALAVYYYLEARNLEGKLASANVQHEDSTKSDISYSRFEVVDSLILKEDYQNALLQYQDMLPQSSGTLRQIIQTRIKILSKLSGYNDQKEFSNPSSTSTTVVNSNKAVNSVGANHPMFDSLNFALAKANARIENLKRQLKNNQNGAHLTFTNTSENEVNYIGQVKNDMANGNGVALFNTGSRYEGEWDNNMRHGEGVYYWPDGQYYKGQFNNDKREGKGVYYWPNGDKFVGQWKDNKRSGFGTFYDKDNNVVAKGIWKDDKLVKEEE